MRVNGRIIRSKAQVLCSILMEIYIMEIGKIITDKVQQYSLIKMVISIKDNTTRIKNMERES